MSMTLEDVRRELTLPAIIADDRGIIIHVNKAFEDLFGWRLAEIAGKPLSIIVPEPLRDAHQMGFSRFLSTGKPSVLGHPFELPALDRSGREIPCEHLIVAEKEKGRWTFGATLRPLGQP